MYWKNKVFLLLLKLPLNINSSSFLLGVGVFSNFCNLKASLTSFLAGFEKCSNYEISILWLRIILVDLTFNIPLGKFGVMSIV